MVLAQSKFPIKIRNLSIENKAPSHKKSRFGLEINENFKMPNVIINKIKKGVMNVKGAS